MWPLSFFLLFATAAPQQKPLDVTQDFVRLTLPVMQHRLLTDRISGRLMDERQRNICFTMRSYMFRRQDGQAPVPAGMTTCTPASVLQQRQVSPGPRGLFVPLNVQQDEQK
jgi:hypothetical protein